MAGNIDFVVLWVDGNDPEWRSEFLKWKERCTCADDRAVKEGEASVDASTERYRDWDLMQYWFRGVEKFAPWVNNIYFVTCGHLPQWLDTSNPRLKVVKHSDFIPQEWLPTFSSIPIELNIHRIKELSETFVYFNDDMFLTRPVQQERFFKEEMPVDMARLSVIGTEKVDHISLECTRVINSRYDKRKSINKNLGKWINPRYGAGNVFKTLTLLPWSFFPGFNVHHMPQPFLKSTFERLWNEEDKLLEKVCTHKFRTPYDVSQWLMRYEQLARGDFKPHGFKDTKRVQISENNVTPISDMIREQRYSMMCLNDNNELENFSDIQQNIRAAFEAILPDKSSFEK